MARNYPLDSIDHPREVHQVLGNSPEAWIRKSRELCFASDLLLESYWKLDLSSPSDVLLPEGRILGVALMLRGMAIECLLKAVWLSSGEKLVEDGEYRKIPGTSDHDLCALLEALSGRVGQAIPKTEKVLLSKLSLYLTRGRYPISKRAEADKMSMRRKRDGQIEFQLSWSTADEAEFEKLADRLVGMIA